MRHVIGTARSFGVCMLTWYAGHGHDHFVKFVHCDGVFDFL